MKSITLLAAAAATTLAACENQIPSAPEQAALPPSNMSASTVSDLNGSASSGISAQASVLSCQGIGLITSMNIQFGTCTTDANGGKGSVAFSSDGLTVGMTAQTHKGAEVVASDWQSNGAVSATSQICVTISVTQIFLRGHGGVQELLTLSYNGAPQNPLISSVSTTGEHTYCGAVPSGANNVFWQLITLDGGGKPASRAKVSQTLIGVSIT